MIKRLTKKQLKRLNMIEFNLKCNCRSLIEVLRENKAFFKKILKNLDNC